VTFHRAKRPSTWRTVAIHAWDRPRDPTVYGVIELDATRALAYLEQKRSETGEKLTLTHLVGKAAAQAIAERPDVNAILRRGRLYIRDTIDIFFQVAFDGGENLAGAKVESADQKDIVAIARELTRRAERIRHKKDAPTQKSADMLSRMPPLLARLAIRAGEILTYDYDLDLTALGVPYDAFGSCMVTNVGPFGLTVGHAPLFPPSRVPIVLTIGAVRPAPVAVDGKVEVRQVLTIGAVFDHRVADGYQAGRMAQRFREVLEDPAKELT
jgi:pyruvate/2-oxoglutarate dehydrogenase complex dihydrolipoamide acyltransferase (E2) component